MSGHKNSSLPESDKKNEHKNKAVPKKTAKKVSKKRSDKSKDYYDEYNKSGPQPNDAYPEEEDDIEYEETQEELDSNNEAAGKFLVY